MNTIMTQITVYALYTHVSRANTMAFDRDGTEARITFNEVARGI